MKTILVATDCKDHSITSLKYAHFLSEKIRAKLIVLYVYDVPLALTSKSSRSAFNIEKFAKLEFLETLNNFCSAHLGAELDKMNISTQVVKNISVSDGILEKSKELGVDMVLVGTKHKDSERGLLAGNIATSLTSTLNCPLLVIPNNQNIKDIETVVYASSFERDDILAIKNLMSIIKSFGAHLHIVHISPESEYQGYDQMEWFKEMLTQKIDYENISFHIFFSNKIYEELTKFTQKMQADMLVMLERKGQGFFGKIIHGDLVKKMEAKNTVPILSFKQEH